MNKFQISNSVSGVDLGIYEAEDAADALEAMAAEAGHTSYAELQKVAPAKEGEILVEVVKAFAADKEAQDAIEGLVVDLIDVAEDAGQIPSDWDSISCDGSLESTLRDLGGQYVAAAVGNDDDLRGEVTEFADEVTVRMTSGKPNELAAAISNAKDLTGLYFALVEARQYALGKNIDIQGICDTTALPTFGGDAIDAVGVFSWNATNMLTGFGEWAIVPRDAEIGETIDQCHGVVIGDIEYRFNDRHYYGSNRVDTIRFARWQDTEDGHAQVFAGYIDIPAFERDTVLVSEMISAIEHREFVLSEDDDA